MVPVTLRLAIGGIEHETSTFASSATTLSQFRTLRAAELLSANRGVRSPIGGMLAAADAIGAEVTGLLHAEAEPGGVIEREAYETLRAELLERLLSARPVDAIALSLHGAGLVADIGDLEADLLAAIRTETGPHVKVVVTLDLHGNNITPHLLRLADLVFGCHRYPHIDLFERGREVVELLPALADGTVVPLGYVERLPMIMPATTSDTGVAGEALALCETVKQRAGMLDCAFFHGFMHTDCATTGASVVAYSNDDAAAAREGACDVARFVWDHRDAFYVPVPDAGEAVKRALAAPPGLVILHEMSDNPGGGAPGDGTHLLRAMIDAKLCDACFATIADPEAAAAAHASGEGTRLELQFGGKADDLHGAPIVATAEVTALTDGRFTLRTPMGAGTRFDLGPSAAVRINGVDVVLVSSRSQVFDPAVLELHRIDIRDYRYLGLKSEHHFRAGFAGLWSTAIPVDGPGISSVNFDRFVWTQPPRPIWPLDRTIAYVPR
jgi:microcystin degradation protein MlrC